MRSPAHRLAARAAACVAALVVLGCGSSPPVRDSTRAPASAHPRGTAVLTRTRVTTWTPFTHDGRLRRGLHAIEHSGGTCDLEGGSHAPVAMLADRCWLGDQILDPCFAPHGRIDRRDPVVVCASAPWERTVTRLRLAHLPPKPSASNYLRTPTDASRTPWALQLTSGELCVYGQGSGGGAGRRRLNYLCGTRGPYASGPYLFGDVDRTRRRWSIEASRDNAGDHLYTATIAHAWR